MMALANLSTVLEVPIRQFLAGLAILTLLWRRSVLLYLVHRKQLSAATLGPGLGARSRAYGSPAKPLLLGLLLSLPGSCHKIQPRRRGHSDRLARQ